jgi:23S rRNA (adenine2503-C2)-methyltransferase
MGMGEPFDNLGEVARATHVLTDHRGLALPRSRVTVSTVGVADKIGAFFQSCTAELAVSLNAPDDARRSEIMPINRRFSIAELVEAIRKDLPRGRKVLFEYVLIRGFNDAEADADTIAEVTRPVPCRVNVIPLNPGSDPSLRAPEQETIDRFVARLASQGVVTLVRRPRGRAASGACGQLVSHLRNDTTRSDTLPPP